MLTIILYNEYMVVKILRIRDIFQQFFQFGELFNNIGDVCRTCAYDTASLNMCKRYMQAENYLPRHEILFFF